MNDKPSDTAQINRFWVVFVRLLGMGAIASLLAMMLLTTADAVARYLFNSPIQGTFELIEILLATSVFLSMPLTTQVGEHVKVDLLPSKAGGLPDILLNLLGALLVASVFMLMTWQVWEHAEKLQRYGTVSNSLSIPVSVVAFLVSICCGISTLAALFSLRASK